MVIQRFNPFHFKWLLCFLLFVCVACNSFASKNSSYQNFPFKVLGDKNTNHIGAQRATVQDKTGYMWFGGDNGLVRYNGYSAILFRHEVDDPGSISANLIYDLLVDSNGTLWIATVYGLNRYDAATQTFIKYFHDPDDINSLPSNDVRSILQDSKGKLWFGTALGLTSFDVVNDQFTRFEPQPTQTSEFDISDIWSLSEDDQNHIWIGCFIKGLFVLDTQTNQITHFRHDAAEPSSLSHASVQVTYRDRRGDMWIGTPGGGLNKYDPIARAFTRFRHDKNDNQSLASDYIRDIFEDHNENFWIATDGGGLSRLNRETGKFESYKNQPGVFDSLRSDKIRSIYEDRSGNLWLGHFPFGMSMLDMDSAAFRNYRHNHLDTDSLSNNSILSILEDAPGSLWVGTEAGLNYLNLQTNKVRRYLHDPKDTSTLAANPALSLHKNQQGLWVGTWSGGLNLLNLQTGKFHNYRMDVNDPNSISGDYIWVIYEDSQNNLWLGSETAGLNRYDPENDHFIRYPTGTISSSMRGSDWVTAIREDSQGNFWVGTDYGLGLMDRDSGKIEYFREDSNNPHSIKGNRVSAIVEDSKGFLWVATHGSGVNRKPPDGFQFTSFDVSNGLADNVVSGIVEDANGFIWFSTGKGLSKFDPVTESFTNFYQSNGLAGEVFNRPAYFRMSTNELAFGSTDGLTIVDPALQVENEELPPVEFIDFKILNKRVDISNDSPLKQSLELTSEIELTHEDLVFSLEFAALNYRSSENNLYSYKLAGFDDSWSPPSDQRTATYTNLDAGDYVFTVKGSNNEGKWNDKGRSIKISVLPPPWKSWPAYAFYSMVVVLIVGIISYQQILKLRDRQRLQLALWGSGDEFWDVDLIRKSVVRKNVMDAIARPNEEFWHHQDMSCIHPEDRPEIARKIDSCLTGKDDIIEVAYRAKNKSGGWVWLLDRGKATKYDAKCMPIRLSGTTKNIDRLKAAEKELIELNMQLEQRVEQRTAELKHTAEELEQSNLYLKNAQKQIIESEKMASLVSMVVGISHELNTPIGNAITTFTVLDSRLKHLYEEVAKGTLSKTIFNRFKEDAQSCATLILENLKRTSSIVDSFKLVAVNQPDNKLNQRSLKDVLDDAVINTQLKSPLNAEHVKINCPDTLMLTTYNNTLREIVMQLMENSLKHAFDEDASIMIEIEAKTLSDRIQITYQDFGKGMDEQTVNHVFDPFYTTNRGVQIGLGMHIVYNQVAHVLQGEITCDSEIEKGTRFVIELPLSH